MTYFGNRNIGTGQTPGSATATSTSSALVPTNLLRSSVFLVNKDRNDVWVSCDVTAVFGVGILLGKNGGSTLIDSTNLTLGPINGITDAGKTALITFQELNIGT